MTPRMHRAGPGEIADVLAVLDEAAAWLGEQGMRQWPQQPDSSTAATPT